MARFFIHRPVFAWVLAIIVMLAGAFGLTSLPIAQYPEIAPTTVQVSATYPGASAEVVESSVTTVLEDAMTGLDGLSYLTSSSSGSSATVTLTFDGSVDPDIAQVQTQNNVQLVTSQLPDIVQQNGIRVSRSTSSILLVGALTSADGSYDSLELGDMVAQLLEDPVQRIPGVGSIQSFGTGYAMRIWLDPMKMVQYQVTPDDVTAAVAEQNSNVTVGRLGALPTTPGQQLSVPISAQSQFSTVAEFERILLRVDPNGSTVFLGDVADIEIGQEAYGSSARFNGDAAAGFAVYLSAGANAVSTATAVQAELTRIGAAMPDGVEIVYPYDTSPFIQESIDRVFHTLIEAVVLVFLVILIFLQSWRATLIPTVAIPVVLLGTFGVLAVAGFTINTLTMFALVLAIGLLVDDAIVVVENVERVMDEEGLSPAEATEKSMGEISSALVGIVLVLCAVFLPMAFMTGSTGVIYRQFSITIITAMILSLGVALILTPAMCASLLRPRNHNGGIAPARWFNRSLERATGGYGSAVARMVRRPFRMLILLVAISGAAFVMFDRLPSSFVPQEDQGVLLVMVETPDGSTAAQTEALVREVEEYLLTAESETVASTFGVLGFSFSGASQNNAMLFVRLKPFADRQGFSAADLTARANGGFYGHRAGQVYFLQPPAIQGMGASDGFSMYLVDQMGRPQEDLVAAADRLVEIAQAGGQVVNLRGNSAPYETSLRLDIDQQKAAAFGLSMANVNSMLSIIFSGRDVNDFTLGNELRPVIVQGQAEARMQPDDVNRWHARNADGEMVPFGAFIDQVWDQEPQGLSRYGSTRALSISGSAAPGVSSGQAMLAMEEAVGELDGGFSVAWVDLSYQERLSGNQAPLLFALSALVVFLCLAALYESWSVPLSVMMTVPIGLLGALIAAFMFDQSNDVYFKVGLLTTIGLAARNAILIVEFAQSLYAEGKTLAEAAVEAAKLRLRPILMTTFAFALGVLPLARASGAGANAQQAIGIGVLGGIIASLVVGIFLVPVFYVAVMQGAAKLRRKPRTAE